LTRVGNLFGAGQRLGDIGELLVCPDIGATIVDPPDMVDRQVTGDPVEAGAVTRETAF
jgi:hypothetical protein